MRTLLSDFIWLQQKVKEWEQYEGEKTSLLQYLKKAEAELEKPQETLAQESAQKELQSKQVNSFLVPLCRFLCLYLLLFVSGYWIAVHLAVLTNTLSCSVITLS